MKTEFDNTENEALNKTDVMRWISVTDRLPDNNMNVLAYKTSGLITHMSFHAPFDSGQRIFQWWGFGTWLNQNRQVTHWMPMPFPPIA